MLLLLLNFNAVGTFVQILKTSPPQLGYMNFLKKFLLCRCSLKVQGLASRGKVCLNYKEAPSTGPIPGHLYTIHMQRTCGQSTVRISLAIMIWYLKDRPREKEHYICTELHKRLRKCLFPILDSEGRALIKVIGSLK